MRLDQAYHMGAFQGAVCNASRHMIMTGRTVWHIPGARSRNSVLKRLRDANPATRKTIGGNPNIPAKLESNTIGAVFNRAGYDTMRTCKKGNSYGAANQQFSVVKDKTNRGADLEKGSAWHADQVLAFLQQREDSKDADPFMIYFGFSHPHDSRNANEELLTKYGAVNELPPNSVPTPTHPHCQLTIWLLTHFIMGIPIYEMRSTFKALNVCVTKQRSEMKKGENTPASKTSTLKLVEF